MIKHSFRDDYSEGAHPSILKILSESNYVQEQGYGKDSISDKAANLIRKTFNNPNAGIHFVSGGTQANIVALSSLLKPYESVIAAETAHIHVHEAGAIEATGHKINTVKTSDGKLTPDKIITVLDSHTDEHMVKPKVVFISNSTEIGTVYSKVELEALSITCRKYNLYLYLDGARLGPALTCHHTDLAYADMSKYLDIYYIGGTKNGALIGEAIVINNDQLTTNFRFHMKQHGALLAKGKLIGAQFLGLFQNNLFFDLARHANVMAKNLADGIKKLGFSFQYSPETNQIFPILPNPLISELEKLYGFHIWQKNDGNESAIRLVMSWATEASHVEMFLKDMARLSDDQ